MLFLRQLSGPNTAMLLKATITDALIYVYSTNDLDFDAYDSSGKPQDGTIYEGSVTVLLFNKKNKKSDVMEEFIEN